MELLLDGDRPERAAAQERLIEVRKRSASALADLTGESIGEDLTAWRDWWEERAGELPADRQIDGR